jgi:hypothetical protein
MSERVDPFGSLDDFAPAAPKPKLGPVELKAIDQVAAENGFPSRQPAKADAAAPTSRVQRRHTTGRNQQLNIKATAATVEQFYRLADEQGVPLGEVLARALDALERAGTK